MRSFLTLISYIFHPIVIPTAGTVAYFIITPRFSTPAFESSNILPIFILTVVIPIVSFLILKNIGLVSSVALPSLKERRYPLLIYIVLLFMVAYKIIPNNFTIELYYYFIGLIGAATTSLILLFLNFKSSIHLTGMGSLLMYLPCLSIHFEMNITIALSILIFCTGLVASARIYLRAHNTTELIIGLFVGMFSQILTIKLWL